MTQTQPLYTRDPSDSSVFSNDNSDTLITRDAEERLKGTPDGSHTKNEGQTSFQVEYRTWLKRTFGPMKPGSVRASIFSLVSTSLGTGILALPFLFKTSGLALGLGFLVLGASVCFISLSMLSYCSFKTKEKEYSILIEKVLGKAAARIMDGLMCFYGFGSSAGYQITISKFIPLILAIMNGTEVAEQSNLRRLIQIAIVTIIAFPISLTRNLYGIRYATYFGVACIFYTLFVVVIQTPSYMRQYNSTEHLVYMRWNLNFFTSFAIASFSFTCHSNLFPVRSELARAKDTRLKKVVARVVGINSLLYFSMGICGYLSLADKTPALIVQRPPLPDVSFDWVMLVALIAISMTLIISIVINIVPTRLQILIMMGKHQNTENRTYTLVTAALVFGTGVVAYLIPNITSALGLIGGIGSVSLSITFPFLLYAKIKEQDTEDGEPSKILIFLIRVLAVVFSLLGIAGAAISFGQGLGFIDTYNN
jgi:amino acid permease